MTVTTNERRTGLVPHTPAQPGRLGQATAVEQSRAVAEVHAAIVVAQQCPRDITRAVADMQRSCAQKSLAEKAFFRYNRGGSQISGPSVQLARELARCWGNIQYGLTELRRDDTYGQSEMQAWAWDVQTNARSSTTFIVPHKRDKTGGPVALTDMRDIYENNANMGARRLREMVFAILPGWYTEDAVTACYDTLASDDSEGDLTQRRAKAVERFAALGVTARQLEQRLGAPQAKWAPFDLAQLSVIYRSLVRRETTREEEFGEVQARVTAADITGQPESPAAGDDTSQQPEGASGEAQGGRDRGNRGAPPSPPQDGPADAPRARAGKTAIAQLDTLLRKFPWRSDPDKAVLLYWACGGPYTASKDQCEKATAVFRGALELAEGDAEAALSALWEAYHAEAAQDQAEAEAGTGGGDGDG